MLIHHRIQNCIECAVCCQKKVISPYFSFAWELLSVIRAPEFMNMLPVKQYSHLSLLIGETKTKRWFELIVAV